MGFTSVHWVHNPILHFVHDPNLYMMYRPQRNGTNCQSPYIANSNHCKLHKNTISDIYQKLPKKVRLRKKAQIRKTSPHSMNTNNKKSKWKTQKASRYHNSRTSWQLREVNIITTVIHKVSTIKTNISRNKLRSHATSANKHTY